MGGNISAPEGQIDLVSVGSGNYITLIAAKSDWQLGYSEVVEFQDILRSRCASVDASGSGGGEIDGLGKPVNLSDGAAILTVTLGENAGGSLTVRATDAVEVIGTKVEGEFYLTGSLVR